MYSAISTIVRLRASTQVRLRGSDSRSNTVPEVRFFKRLNPYNCHLAGSFNVMLCVWFCLVVPFLNRKQKIIISQRNISQRQILGRDALLLFLTDFLQDICVTILQFMHLLHFQLTKKLSGDCRSWAEALKQSTERETHARVKNGRRSIREGHPNSPSRKICVL